MTMNMVLILARVQVSLLQDRLSTDVSTEQLIWFLKNILKMNKVIIQLKNRARY